MQEEGGKEQRPVQIYRRMLTQATQAKRNAIHAGRPINYQKPRKRSRQSCESLRPCKTPYQQGNMCDDTNTAPLDFEHDDS
jgi:hypothetical protein